jgi:subtilisin family serine protease
MKRSLPAAYSNAIAVSNVNYYKDDPKKADSSNFGMWVDIAAPGSPSYSSTVPGGSYSNMGGTSMSAPVVSGVAGLVLAAEPNLSASELEDRLLRTSIPDKLYADGINDDYRPVEDGIGLVPLLGSGVVNAFLALNPEGITTPTVVAVRPDAVTAGCGVIAGASSASMIFILLPLLLTVFRKREA